MNGIIANHFGFEFSHHLTFWLSTPFSHWQFFLSLLFYSFHFVFSLSVACDCSTAAMLIQFPNNCNIKFCLFFEKKLDDDAVIWHQIVIVLRRHPPTIWQRNKVTQNVHLHHIWSNWTIEKVANENFFHTHTHTFILTLDAIPKIASQINVIMCV